MKLDDIFPPAYEMSRTRFLIDASKGLCAIVLLGWMFVHYLLPGIMDYSPGPDYYDNRITCTVQQADANMDGCN